MVSAAVKALSLPLLQSPGELTPTMHTHIHTNTVKAGYHTHTHTLLEI